MNKAVKALALAAIMTSTFVTASGAADTIEQIDSDLVAADAIAERSILLGIGAGFQPLYEGSDEFRAFPVPIFSYDSGVPGPRRFEFRGLDDIRFHALRLGNFSTGPIVGYRFGRDEDDSARLRGLGNIDGGLVVGGFASYEFYNDTGSSWGADIGISSQVTGDAFDEGRFAGLPTQFDDGYGYEIDFGISNEMDITDRFNLATRIGATYASDDYLQTNFGVGVAQAAAAIAAGNGIAAYDADGGIKNAYFNVSGTYELTNYIQLRAGLGYSRLMGDAADSPITETENQFSGSIGAAYRFTF
ncbi:MipA/OmpV family protein [Ahrensia sp. R2A130]|uniref:MipA/OmpV family protein n=1 Tax=Ahrensia sp. R2A130 TaxID=744979 RepID=UPI0001E09BFF|nr:MipA/OmpV family protein [Ahrensia sp. R2A130]EFL90030.1 MipA family protein [Ahrensia sp. R2A130]